MPHLQMTKEEFTDFRKHLFKLGDLKSVEEQQQSESLSKVIDGIGILQEVLVSRIVHFLKTINGGEVLDEIEGLVKKSCPVEVGNFWEKLRGEDAGWFYFRKTFQLSHLHGVSSRNLENCAELGDYFYLQLYTDYYETFAKRVKCFMIQFDTDLANSLGSSTKQFYTSICYPEHGSELGLEVLKLMEIEDYHNKIRNSINHGGLIAHPDRLEYIPLNAHASFTEPKDDYIPKIRAFITYSVLFSTQLDLQLFKLMKSGENINEPLWKEYFDLYLNSWKRHQELFG